ncbi:MAG: pyridoxal-phosphate dependent enzyme [Leptospirales bacterium]
MARRIPHLELCDLPTPIESCERLAASSGAAGIAVKRDDLSAAAYGGNKIRKLEFLLADARARGAAETLTFGYAGSNFAAATAYYAKLLGMRGISMLTSQKPAPYVLQNLRFGRVSGAELRHVPGGTRGAAIAAARRLRSLLTRGRAPYLIPVGGSSPVGVLGFVNAALELGAQVERGETARPDRIYIALGSMGSVAGLLIGLRLLGWDATEIIATRALDQTQANAAELYRLYWRTARFLRRLDPAFAFDDANFAPRAFPWTSRGALESAARSLPVQIREEYYGGVYGETPASRRALDHARQTEDLSLDPTYSGKAMAALLDDAEAGLLKNRTVLFWATYNSRPLEPLLKRQTTIALPRDFAHYEDCAPAGETPASARRLTPGSAEAI